ncbi:unnamed protein product [Arctia plantaginis]|uniref:Uncharacterized protein n=1 Tax=Arctia plantaginis TaxID=874455 RepID=A0A8S1AMR3_ARCPL|nr:unnamed protein product [Arctia plantaginis]
MTSSLLSRFRNTNEYVASPDTWLIPEDIPKDVYENLLDELPELREQFETNDKIRINDETEMDDSGRRFKFLPFIGHLGRIASSTRSYRYWKSTNGSVFNFTFPKDIYTTHPNVSETITNVTDDIAPKTSPFTSKLPSPSSSTIPAVDSHIAVPNITTFAAGILTKTRSIPSIWDGDVKIRCFWCGLNEIDIPRNPICHDAFQSLDWRVRFMARYFRASQNQKTIPFPFSLEVTVRLFALAEADLRWWYLEFCMRLFKREEGKGPLHAMVWLPMAAKGWGLKGFHF